MKERPSSVLVIGCVFIAAGVVGFVYHAAKFKLDGPFQSDLVWVSLVRLLAIAGGAFLLTGSNWARWLLIVWIAYHVGLSVFHSRSELAVHIVLLAVITWLLFRPAASAYFRRAGVELRDEN